MGHRRIAFIKGHPSLSASAQRLQGFEAAMQEAGCELRPELIAQGYFDYRSGLQAADKLLKLAEPPTAIFASNDDMAAGAVSAAHRRGLDVPGDISVAGFDDTPILAAVWPSVTTIRQPVARMAGYAIDQLFREIRARQAGMRGATVDRVVAHSLVERETVAAPRR
jgi:LacI family transcriptional regulator